VLFSICLRCCADTHWNCRHAIACGDQDAVNAADKFIAVELLKQQFGSAEVDEKSGEIVVEIPSNRVSVDWETQAVHTEPEDAALRARVLTCLKRLKEALKRVDPQVAGTKVVADDGAEVTG
jgi:hypothetical protein